MQVKNIVELLRAVLELSLREGTHRVSLWDGWDMVIEETGEVPHIYEIPEKILRGDFFNKVSNVAHNFGKNLVVSFKEGVTKKIYITPQVAQ